MTHTNDGSKRRRPTAPTTTGSAATACEGTINGRFRGANYPLRRTPDGPFCPDLRAVIETDDGAIVMVECHGYGRAYPQGRRQIVGSLLHLSDRDPYRRLNDVNSW